MAISSDLVPRGLPGGIDRVRRHAMKVARY